MSRPDTLPLSFDSENIKHPLYFDDAGVAEPDGARTASGALKQELGDKHEQH